MNQQHILDTPEAFTKLQDICQEIGFTMPSDVFIGSLLKTLISSKTNSNILELGTGIGLSLSWMIDGLDQHSSLISVDNDPKLIDIVSNFFKEDPRVQLICQDAAEWIHNYNGKPFDLIFADAWPGKYSDLDATINLLKVGGLYVIDDMTPQTNWPDGHAEKAEKLIADLESRKNLNLTKMEWSTGVMVCTKVH